MHLLQTVGRGAVAGAVATIAMSVPMLAATRLGLIQEQAPQRITDRLLSRFRLADDVRDESSREALAAANHVAFGAVGGAGFALLARRLPSSIPLIPAGMAYAALGIWTVSYAGWAPALRLMPPPDEDEPGRPVLMIAAHLIYGAVLGALTPKPAASPDRTKSGGAERDARGRFIAHGSRIAHESR